MREISVKNKKDVSDINLIPNSSLVFYYFEGYSAPKIDSKWFIMLKEVLFLILELMIIKSAEGLQGLENSEVLQTLLYIFSGKAQGY